MRVLVVEDDDTIRQFVVQGLREARYAVDSVVDGHEALAAAEVFDYDVIVLDIGIPGIDGLEVCRRVKLMATHAAVLMLTARDTVDDRVEGLDAGADDYLVKPFAFAEFLARVRALLRRGGGEPAVLQVAGVSLNPATHDVTVEGRPVYLSNKEFMLLEYLMRNAGRVTTKSMISEHYGTPTSAQRRTLSRSTSTLCAKKSTRPAAQPLIQTVRGAGYKLQAVEAVASD